MSRTISRNDRRNTTRSGPPIVQPDRDDGCETVACYIAQTFYNACQYEISKITSRNQLRKYFLNSQKFWMPPELTERNETRHFDQVLYALVNDGKVCRVKKSQDGSHIVLWAFNNFRRQRTGPRKRINPPVPSHSQSGSDNHSTTVVYDHEEPGEPLTMEDLEVGEVSHSPTTIVQEDN